MGRPGKTTLFAGRAETAAGRAAPVTAAILAATVLSLLLVSAACAADDPGLRHAPSRIEQWHEISVQVAAMPRSAAGETKTSGPGDVWFVGFAGYGEQKVFRKEAELARRVFGARYAAADRSLLLVNDVTDRRSYPLATFDNLRYALRQIARRMDLEHDTLVLLLTSHGNDQDGIAITNDRLADDALSPEDLRKVLDEVGIRWRVVIVSACYSGIFIPVLSSDSTLVMTAADASHSSFGCADDRDLTWFGEALLQDTLPKACSLEGAYRDMARLIRHREADEGEEHSNPRLFEGARMREKLKAIDAADGRACVAPGRQSRHRPR